jgi:hypothetical protein
MPKIHVPNYVAQAIEKETAEKNKKLKEKKEKPASEKVFLMLNKVLEF